MDLLVPLVTDDYDPESQEVVFHVYGEVEQHGR